MRRRVLASAGLLLIAVLLFALLPGSAAFAAPDTTPPTVGLVAPVPLSTDAAPLYLSSANFPFQASASDAESGVASVSFWAYPFTGLGYAANGTQVGTTQTAGLSGVYGVAASLTDNRYQLLAKAVDNRGNEGLSPVQYVVVDTVNPTAALTSPPAGQVVRGTVPVTGTASDTNLDHYDLALAPTGTTTWTSIGEDSLSVTGGQLLTLDTTPIADGTYDLQLTAVDKAGHESTATVSSLSIHNQGPTLVSAVPFDATHLRATFSADIAPASVEASGTAFTLSGGLSVSGASVETSRTMMLTTSHQSAGSSYTLTVMPAVTDLLGNPVGTPNTATFTGFGVADNSAPVTVVSASPPAPDPSTLWFRQPVTITLTASDPGGNAGDPPPRTEYAWGTTVPADGPWTTYTGSFLASVGTNTLWFRSIDAAGNVETPQSQVFKVDADLAQPTLDTPQGTEAQPKAITGSVYIQATVGDTNSGIAQVAFYVYRLLSTSPTATYESVGSLVGSPQTAPLPGFTDKYGVVWSTALAAEGQYRVEAEVRDNAGNTLRSAGQFVIVDNGAPTVKLTKPISGAYLRGSVPIEGSVSERNLTGWTLDLRTYPDGTFQSLEDTSSVAAGTLFTLDTAGRDDGRYELRLSATDKVGHVNEVLASPVMIDNKAPTVVSATAGTSNLVDVTFSEEVATSTTKVGAFSITGLTVSAAQVLPGDPVVRLTTSQQIRQASYTVAVDHTVTDRAGNPLGTPDTATFGGYLPVRDNVPPATPAGVQAVAGDGKNVVTWTANIEPDLSGYNVYRDTSATGTFQTKANGELLTRGSSFDDTSLPAPGVYYYKVTAVDMWGNESAPSAPVAADTVRISKVIGTSGGVLQSATGDVRLSIPAGALSGNVTIQIRELPKPDHEPAFTFASPSYEFLPSGQKFNSNVSITLREDSTGLDESAIRLVYGPDGTVWTEVEGGSSVDRQNHTVTGQVNHFTFFSAAKIEPNAPQITVTPANGATNVPVTAYVTLLFSKPMDPQTLTEQTVQLGEGGGTSLDARVVVSPDATKAFLYPRKLLSINQRHTVFVDKSVRDATGVFLGKDFTSGFLTASVGVSPHDAYSTSSNLCQQCHVVHRASGPDLLTEKTEKEICYTCHDGTGSSYNVKTTDAAAPFSSGFGEATIGTTSQLSYHPVPAPAKKTGVVMQCTNCHNAHGMIGIGARLLAVKKLEAAMTGAYKPRTGNDFCWSCHDKTADAAKGYVKVESWNASTGYDHKTYYPAAGTSHNDPNGIGFANAKVPTKQNIVCKGCHSEHGTVNSKLIADTVNDTPVSFDASSDARLNQTYNNLCNACHSNAGVSDLSWMGATVYATSGHGASTVTQSLTYAPPIPGVGQVIQVNLCKQCHEPHGTGDANGAFPALTRNFEQQLCFRCHAVTNRPGQAKDLVTTFNRRYGHDLTMSDTTSRRHDLAAETSRLDPDPQLSGGNRHVECTDCHNPHAAKNATQQPGHSTVPPVLDGVMGVGTTASSTPFSDPSAWTWRAVYPTTQTYQVCFKCHSAAAYGTAPPARATVEATSTPGYWPSTQYTDQAREFNPANASYHAVWGPSKATPDRGSYLAGWSATSAMDCTACHRSDNDADPRGTHGSGTPFMLGGYTTPSKSRYVTGPNGGAPYASQSVRDADFAFCLGCHDAAFGLTGFNTGGGENLHTSAGHVTRACTNCHVAVPHGFNRPHLLVTTTDQAPYNDHAGQQYGIVEAGSNLNQVSGAWSKADCATTGPCHTP